MEHFVTCSGGQSDKIGRAAQELSWRNLYREIFPVLPFQSSPCKNCEISLEVLANATLDRNHDSWLYPNAPDLAEDHWYRLFNFTVLAQCYPAAPGPSASLTLQGDLGVGASSNVLSAESAPPKAAVVQFTGDFGLAGTQAIEDNPSFDVIDALPNQAATGDDLMWNIMGGFPNDDNIPGDTFDFDTTGFIGEFNIEDFIVSNEDTSADDNGEPCNVQPDVAG
jgi:hypothetical protein